MINNNFNQLENLSKIENWITLSFYCPFFKFDPAMLEVIRQLNPSSFCTDSRQIQPGSIFFALKGEKVDGHYFLWQAAEKGACGAVVQEGFQGPAFGLPLIRVPDVLEALQLCAKEWLKACQVRVVAVTGSVGKTSTKEFVAALLKRKYRVALSPGNSNSQVGLPLAILNHLKATDQILVQEMGMTEAGQISRLIEIAPPEAAILTMVALVHACNFESLSDIALAKAEIFGSEQTKLGIVLRDLEDFGAVCRVGNCPKISFSVKEPGADYFLDKTELYEKGKWALSIKELPVPGEHNRQNLLAAIAAARYFSLTWAEIAEGITQLTLPERRLQFVEKKGLRFLNDSYNASAVSMKASFKSLPKPPAGGKTVAVLGEMLELGKFSESCHREVGEAALNVVDSMICFGRACGPIVACFEEARKPVQWTCDRAEMMKIIRDTVKEGDVVLLKGSRANELWKVIEDL